MLDCQGHSRLWDGSGWLQPWGKLKLQSGAGNESGTSAMGRYKRGLILWSQNSLQWTRVVLGPREMGALQRFSTSAEEGAVTPITLSSLIQCCAAPSHTVMKTTSLNCIFTDLLLWRQALLRVSVTHWQLHSQVSTYPHCWFQHRWSCPVHALNWEATNKLWQRSFPIPVQCSSAAQYHGYSKTLHQLRRGWHTPPVSVTCSVCVSWHRRAHTVL